MQLLTILGDVVSSLRDLGRRAARAANSDIPEQMGYRPNQLRALCGIVDSGVEQIVSRATELGAPPGLGEPTPGKTTRRASAPAELIGVYRRCCELLCAASREAARLQDEVTRARLGRLILQLEKQLWLIDAPSHLRGIDGGRCISLFFHS